MSFSPGFYYVLFEIFHHSESGPGVAPKTESESPPPPAPIEVSLPASLDLKRERPPKEDIQNKLNKFCSVCQVRQGETDLPAG